MKGNEVPPERERGEHESDNRWTRVNDSSSGRSPAHYLPDATVALVILCHVHPSVFICLSFNEVVVVVVSRRTSTGDLVRMRELHVNMVVRRGETFPDYRCRCGRSLHESGIILYFQLFFHWRAMKKQHGIEIEVFETQRVIQCGCKWFELTQQNLSWHIGNQRREFVFAIGNRNFWMSPEGGIRCYWRGQPYVTNFKQL